MKKSISIIAALMLLTLTSCTKKIYVPVENVVHHTDTLHRFVTLREKLELKDSVTTETRGDTVWRTIVRHRNRYVTLTDTLRSVRTDTLRITRTLTIPSPKQSRAKPFLWGLAAGLLLMAGILIWFLLRRR